MEHRKRILFKLYVQRHARISHGSDNTKLTTLDAHRYAQSWKRPNIKGSRISPLSYQNMEHTDIHVKKCLPNMLECIIKCLGSSKDSQEPGGPCRKAGYAAHAAAMEEAGGASEPRRGKKTSANPALQPLKPTL